MEKSKQIQIGLLGLVALLLVLNFTGVFDGIFGSGSDAAKDEARTSLETNVTADVTTPGTTTAPAGKEEPAAPAGPTTVVTFDELEFDYGIVDAGEKVQHTYKFKNTGSEPLIISNAKGSCGCTVPSWPKEPIPVGGTGEIDVVFDSKGKKGKQSKRVTITANTDPVQTFLTIKGEVKGAEGETTSPQPIKPQSPAQ